MAAPDQITGVNGKVPSGILGSIRSPWWQQQSLCLAPIQTRKWTLHSEVEPVAAGMISSLRRQMACDAGLQDIHQGRIHERVIIRDIEADDSLATQEFPESSLELRAMLTLHDEDNIGR